MPPPHWQLPEGVTRGLWDYVHSDSIADDYDEYFAFNQLFDFDEQVVLRALSRNGCRGLVADLGCGTGRALVTLCRQGFEGLAIDLSQRMLEIVQEKAWEFAGEYCRWFDLIRLEMVEEVVDKKHPDDLQPLGTIQYYVPLPASETGANPNLKDNE